MTLDKYSAICAMLRTRFTNIKILPIRCLSSINPVNRTCESSKIVEGTVINNEIQEKQNSQSQDSEHKYEDNIKESILSAALLFVEKDGWSKEALSAAAESLGYQGVAHGLFPNGGADLINYFQLKCNEQLVDFMKELPNISKSDEKEIPAKFIEDVIMTRLLMINPYKKTWAKAMAIQAMPSNAQNSLHVLLTLADDICYHSGDRSVDIKWYIRRVGLAGIYKAAELYFLNDNSPDGSATRKFVASRIREAQLLKNALNLGPSVSFAPEVFSGVFTTARNILGINNEINLAAAAKKDNEKINTNLH